MKTKIILLTLTLVFILGISQTAWATPNIPMIETTAEETTEALTEAPTEIITEATTEPTTEATTEQSTEQQRIEENEKFNKDIMAIFLRVAKKYKLNDYGIGFYVEEINSGNNSVYGNELVYEKSTGKTKGKFGVASAVKLPLSLVALKELEASKKPLEFEFKDRLSKKVYSMKTVIKNAVSKSINAQYNVLFRHIGPKAANKGLESIGVMNSTLNNELGGGDAYWSTARMKREYGTTINSRFTPEDLGIVLRYVYDGAISGNSYMKFLEESLLNNIYSSRIPKGINYKYPVGHKTGTYTDKGRFADAGIVYLPNNPYIIVLLLDYQTNIRNCEPFMREMAKEINIYMEIRIAKTP